MQTRSDRNMLWLSQQLSDILEQAQHAFKAHHFTEFKKLGVRSWCLYGTCWVQLFIRAMGIDFDFSIFLMSSWFGYMGSGGMKLVRTKPKKNYEVGKIYFYWPLPFYWHPFFHDSCSPIRFPSAFIMFGTSINAGPFSLENSSCSSPVKFICWVQWNSDG